VDPLPADALDDPSMPPSLFVFDSSRFGTTLFSPYGPEQTVSKEESEPTLVPDGASLRFGTGAAQAVVEYSPLVACGAALDAASHAAAAVHAAQLGMHLLPAWHDNCTVLLVAGAATRASQSPAAVCALLSAVPSISLAWLTAAAASGGADDPASSMGDYAVALADATGAPLVAASFPPRAGMLLRGVSLLFGPAEGTPHPQPPLAALASALSPVDGDLAAAVRLAGGAACALGEAVASDVADAAGRGERGMLLVLRPDGGARLRGTPWAAAGATDASRVLTTLVTGALGGLQAAAAAAPTQRSRAAPAPEPAPEGSDTEEDAGDAPRATAPAAPPARPGGFQSFAADRRGRGGAAATVTAPLEKPAAAEKAAKKGKGPAKAKAAEEAEEELVDPDFMGAIVLDASLFARLPAPPAEPTATQARRGAQPDAPPNFKRFRKVPLLPSSSTFGLLVPYEAEPDAFTAVDDYADETRAVRLPFWLESGLDC
jgi:hypothetical protein